MIINSCPLLLIMSNYIGKAVRGLVRSHHIHGPHCPCSLNSKIKFMRRGMSQIAKEAFQIRNQQEDLLLPAERLVTSAFSRKESYSNRLSRRFSHQVEKPIPSDYAFDMVGSHIRYGLGVTFEVGSELKYMKCKNVMVLTDPYIASLKNGPLQTVINSLEESKVPYQIYRYGYRIFFF